MVERTLSGDDLRHYSETFRDLTRVTLPPEYLGRGVVRGWYDGGRLAAGFACVTRPPYRVVDQLPAGCLDAEAGAAFAEGAACEFNGLFIRPECRSSLDIVAFVKAIFRTFLDTGRRV